MRKGLDCEGAAVAAAIGARLAEALLQRNEIAEVGEGVAERGARRRSFNNY